MLAWIRVKFGRTAIFGIIGFIAFVFVFYGVFSPKSTRGLHEGAVAGTVNGDPISLGEFNREYNRMLELYKNFLGGKITDEQMKAFKLKESAFQGLARQKVLLQEAARYDLAASDQEVMEDITHMSVFHKDGKFDVQNYNKILELNHLSPGGFEKLKREELSQKRWAGFFRSRVHVSEQEALSEFKIQQNKRNLKYVLITNQQPQQAAQVDAQEVQKYLADPAHLEQVKARYEEAKNTSFKGQKFEAVRDSIAQSILLGERLSQSLKANQVLADQVVGLLKADSSSDARLNALLKTHGAEVKKTGLISSESEVIPGVGLAKEVMRDAFSESSPIDAASGGQAKKYLMGDRLLVALVIDSQKPDLKQFDAQRAGLLQQLYSRKMRSLYQAWESGLMQRAKIDINPAVVSSSD